MNRKWTARIPLAAYAVLGYLALSSAYMATGVHRAGLMRATYAPAPAGMVLVPPGFTILGSADPLAGADEGDLHSEFIPAFYIDVHEVTNAEYRKINPAFEFAPGREDYPATGITRAAAREYAARVGKRLPTRAEWEKAARGTDGRAYPWGNDFRGEIANLGGSDGLCRVGTHPEGASPYGAQDMAGNAWEWVDDTHSESSLFGRRGQRREIIKGGAYAYSANEARASYNGFEAVGSTCNDVGFRCAMDARRL